MLKNIFLDIKMTKEVKFEDLKKRDQRRGVLGGLNQKGRSNFFEFKLFGEVHILWWLNIWGSKKFRKVKNFSGGKISGRLKFWEVNFLGRLKSLRG